MNGIPLTRSLLATGLLLLGCADNDGLEQPNGIADAGPPRAEAAVLTAPPLAGPADASAESNFDADMPERVPRFIDTFDYYRLHRPGQPWTWPSQWSEFRFEPGNSSERTPAPEI